MQTVCIPGAVFLEKNRETKLLVHQILSLQYMYKAGSHWVSESQSAQRDV